MTAFIVLSVLALLTVGAAALPFIVIGAAIWLILIPIRLLFRLAGVILGMALGLIGGVLGLIIGPIVAVIAAIVVIGAVLAAALPLVAPLLPVALLGLLVWAVYRLAKRPTPAF